MDSLITGVKERGFIKSSMPRNQNPLDAELEELISKQKSKIKVIGCGGGGNNTINRISEVGITGIETIAINTDAQDLLYTNADTKILIGKTLTHGLGALTVAIVTMPFAMEGQRRYENALFGLEKLESLTDTLIVIPNDKLLDLAPDLPLHTAFKVADEILTNSVKGIAELVTKTGLVNLDFADIRTVMGKGGVAVIGVGESDSENRAVEAVEKAINNPLLDVSIDNAVGALINVAGGPDMTLDEARKVVETVSSRLDPNARIIWGAQISEDLTNTIRVMLIVTGVNSPQIFGPKKKLSQKLRKEIESELGIEFIN